MPRSPHLEQTPQEALDRIGAVTDAALAHLEGDDLMNELLERVRELLSADTAAVLHLDPTGEHLTAVAAKGLEAEVHQGTRIPVGVGFAGRIAATRQPVIIEDVDHAQVRNPILRLKGIRSLLGVPLLAAGTVTGVLHVGTLAGRAFTEQDIGLLQLAAERVALATEAQRTRADRDAAVALQRSLVPATLPHVDGYELGARYVPGQGSVGGDWYDVFPLPSGEVGIVVGDVAGAGLPAAVVMGRLRSALRSYALETLDPAEVITKLNRKVRHFEPDSMATVLYGVADPRRAEIRVSVAGHPLPLHARSGRPTIVLDLPVDPPVGVDPIGGRRSETVGFGSESLLCFYTDGLIERRDRSLDTGIELLGATVTPDRHPDLVCADVMVALIGDAPPLDDTALLAVRAVAPGSS